MLNYLYGLATDKEKGFIAGAFKFFLFLLSLVYGLAVRLLRFAYGFNRYRPDCRVISVGNITLGGTGKTSLVEFIARYLKQQGRKVAILSRGYKKPHPAPRTPHPAYVTMGDEPYMLQMNLPDIPVIVDANRIRGLKKIIRDYSVDTVILDDGFQQWKIKKDLEIVTIDCNSPFGNRRLLPRGILREPLSSLSRADVFVLTKVNLNPDAQNIKDFLSRLNPKGLLVESAHRPLGFYGFGCNNGVLDIGVLKGKTVTLFSGIGEPDSFENLIRSLNINIGLSFRFPDHYDYAQEDLENIIQESQRKKIDTIITTEKDAARLRGVRLSLPAGRQGFIGSRFLVLRIELKIISNEESFYNRLLGVYTA